MSLNEIKDSNIESETLKLISLLLGLWPTSFLDSMLKKIIKLIINLIACSLMIFVIVSNILYGIYQINNTMDQKVELIGATNFYIMSLTKYLLLLFRGKSIRKCLEYIDDDWRLAKFSSKNREIMLNYAQFGRYMTIICAIFMYFGGIGYQVLKPISSGKIITEMNITITPFPSPVYGKKLTSGFSPIYEILYGTLIVADFYLYSATVVAFSIAAVLTIHACGQFEIVIYYLNDLVNQTNNNNNDQEKLIVIVNSHLRILSFVSQLEALLNEICFIEVLDCSLNLCLLGYCLITSWKQGQYTALMSYSVLLVSFIFIIYIYCYLGQLLTTQAEKIGQQGYMIEWHRLPKRVLLDLLFFIHVCQFPTTISAGKIIVLSIGTFSAVMRTSAAYFNALWKISQ
ncbi:odorant receptor 63a-like [Leptopilina boulardi]|uniref:odorant receptor 63a-like n=1 Tax=Leptopilina boulardi TaxID=63433 RepID=UPI0021F5D385|nr:odorant receptor 63a-like [Leptopilina boulardi]